MFYENIVDILKNLEVKGSRYGVESTRRLLDRLGSPDDKLKIVHVAGTNGKGSFCEYLSCILTCAGKKAGAYTSPAVFSYGEKFRINGEELPQEKLKRYLSESYTAALELAAEGQDMPTAFEIETAASLSAFAKEGCEYAVVECGLGGLTDATNAIRKKEVAAILSIGLEHTALLGDTVEKICEQKAGIIKNCPAVVSALQPEEARAYFRERGAHFAGEGLKRLSSGEEGQTFEYCGERYFIRMRGVPQLYNAAAAIDVAALLRINGAAVKAGLARAKLAGRVEFLRARGKTYVLDGSHNPASFAPLVEEMQKKGAGRALIYGCLSDKDAEKAAEILSGIADRATVVPPPSFRAMGTDKMLMALKQYFKNVSRCGGVSAALESAEENTVIVCGTFTILKEAKEWIEKRQ